jgi:hypothetical protein
VLSSWLFADSLFVRWKNLVKNGGLSLAMQSRPFLTHRPRLRTALSSLALAALCCLPQAGAQSAAATGGSTAAPYRLRIVGGL